MAVAAVSDSKNLDTFFFRMERGVRHNNIIRGHGRPHSHRGLPTVL